MNVEFAPMAFAEASDGSAVLLVKLGGWQRLELGKTQAGSKENL